MKNYFYIFALLLLSQFSFAQELNAQVQLITNKLAEVTCNYSEQWRKV